MGRRCILFALAHKPRPCSIRKLNNHITSCYEARLHSTSVPFDMHSSKRILAFHVLKPKVQAGRRAPVVFPRPTGIMFWKTEVPMPDERMLKNIEKLQLNESDLKTLYKRFSKSDKEVRVLSFPSSHALSASTLVGAIATDWVCSNSGSIDRDEFFRSFGEQRTAVGDAVFALIDIDNSGELDFSEYVEALGAFCLLNTEEVLKFCFFVFDQDKNGTIEGNELDALLEMLHQDNATSNMAAAVEKFDFNGDGKVDFAEFVVLNQQFPALLYPVYRLQLAMKEHTMGESWWIKRADLLNELKFAKEHPEGDQQAVAAAKAKEQRRKTKQNMGCLKYYLCPCRRSAYVVDDSGITEEALIEEAKQRELEAQKKKLEDAMRARASKEKRTATGADGRKIMSKEERKERAKKRRQRDMKDLPSRK
ncbi:Aste57867_19134 [Aphanomyces stellatus]|uniref:Aste57867_19134 protein n=1 Tax=Aphanomyces stellatus TaxID=120398 RepID=A0A485LC24_9STRA|nr:hypothetical protein As57867_019070 [Aphanomyces stellatus]VFT95857.1 Aste57867_19134 [Aphanomyces stellatus]